MLLYVKVPFLNHRFKRVLRLLLNSLSNKGENNKNKEYSKYKSCMLNHLLYGAFTNTSRQFPLWSSVDNVNVIHQKSTLFNLNKSFTSQMTHGAGVCLQC